MLLTSEYLVVISIGNIAAVVVSTSSVPPVGNEGHY